MQKEEIKLLVNLRTPVKMYKQNTVFIVSDAPVDVLNEFEAAPHLFTPVLDLRRPNLDSTLVNDKPIEEMNVPELRKYIKNNNLPVKLARKDDLEKVISKIREMEKEAEIEELRKETAAEIEEKEPEKKEKKTLKRKK